MQELVDYDMRRNHGCGKLFLSILAVVFTSGLVWSKCPNVRPMRHFMDRDLEGNWYAVALTNKWLPFYPNQTCLQMEATKNGNIWTMNGTGIDAVSGKLDTWKFTGPMQMGKPRFNLTLETNDGQTYKHELIVLGSDKKDFIVIFSCSFTDDGYVWVYTRRPGVSMTDLPIKEQAAISWILLNNDISPFNLNVPNNTNCAN